MGRSTAKPAQIPGAPPTDATDLDAAGIGVDAPDVGAAPDAAEGEGETKFVTNKGRKPSHEEKDAEIAALKAELAEAKRLPQVVYEPKTPHGLAALASSDTAGMTVKQVMAAIDAGQLREPLNSYLCADGYYARRVEEKKAA